LRKIAAGDYAHFGEIALATEANADDIANIGVVVGRDAVAVIDAGGSPMVGRAVLAAVRALSATPVAYVINTHEHPDHVFGNAAFVDAGVTFVGHRNLPQSMQAHGPHYLRSLRAALGASAMDEVRLIPPTLLVDDRLELDLGDRKLLLIAWSPTAHSDCDLTVLDERTGTLFAGDLLFIGHVPAVDGSLAGWLKLMPALAALPARRVVPGHGPAAEFWPTALDAQTAYLLTLQRDARRSVAAGDTLQQAMLQIGRSERSRWALFDAYNARNAAIAFSEAEWE
jgi:quinoprotein relay system zinc metallohydrolase 2